MAKTIAFELVKVGDGVAAFQGGPDEAFLNPMGGPRPRGMGTDARGQRGALRGYDVAARRHGGHDDRNQSELLASSRDTGGSTRSRGLYRKALAYFRPRVQSSTRKAACSRTEPP